MFRFRLEKILKLKMSNEDMKKTEFSKVAKRLDETIKKKDNLLLKKSSLISEMKSLTNDVAGMKMMNEYNNYLIYLKSVIKKVERNIEFLKQELERKRKELEEAIKERKILENFKEKELEIYNKAQAKIEEGIVNEFVSYQYSERK